MEAMEKKRKKASVFLKTFFKKIIEWCKKKKHLICKPIVWVKERCQDAGWLYTILIKRYLLRDKNFLSSIVHNELKPYKKELKTKIHFGEIASEKWCIVSAVVLPSILTVVFLLLLKISFVSQNLSSNLDINTLSTTLNSTAVVVAGFTGILVALIAFGINVNTLYVGAEDHLFQMIIRRGGYMFIAALSVGVVALSLVAGMFAEVISLNSLIIITICVLALGIIVLLSEIWLLSYTLRSIGKKACRELLSKNFKDGHRKSLLAEIKRRIGFNVFKKQLEVMGFDLNVFHTEPTEGEVAYKLKKAVYYLNDIYFPPLRVLSERWGLKEIDKSEDASFSRIMNHDKTIIPKVPAFPYSNQNPVAIIGKREDENSKIERLIYRGFICGKKPKLVIPDSNWDALGRMLKAQIRDSNDSGLEDLLNVVEAIIVDYLSSLKKMGVAHSRPDIFSSAYTNYKSPELSNLDFRELIVIASESADTNCVKLLFKFLNMVGRTAFDEKSLEYYSDILLWIGALYYYCGPKQGLSDFTQQELIDSFNFLGPLTFQSYLYKKDKSLEAYEEISSYIEHYLGKFLIVAKNAAINEDSKTFEKLFDILGSLPMDEHSSPRSDYELAKRSISHVPDNLSYQNKLAVSEARLNIHCLVNLTRTVISAWLAELCKVNKLNHELASTLVETAMEPIKETTDLFEVYLQASGNIPRSSLGYDWWDHVDHLAGQAYSTWGSAFDRWIEPFWIAYSLKLAGCKRLHSRNSANLRLLVGFREYHFQKIEKQLEQIIANEEFYNWFAKKDDLEKGKEYILRIFSEIKERQEQMDLEKLLSSPLSPQKVTKFKKDCTKGYEGKNKIFNLCLEFGVAGNAAVVKWSNNVSRKRIQRKEHFIEDWHVSLGGQWVFGEEIAEIENLWFSRFIEDNLIEQRKIENIDHITSNLKAIAEEMRSTGLTPNIILIPEDHKYQSLFTSKPHWRREFIYMKEGLPQWVSSFDGMEVFIWSKPMTSIAIIDVNKFLTLNIQGELDVKLEEVSSADVEGWLEKEKGKPEKEKKWHKELEEYGDIENLSKAYLWSELTAKTRLGIVDEKAGAKFEIDEKKIGVLCDKAKRVCHTIDCKIATTIPEEEREYYPTASYARVVHNYNPCEECDPLWGEML